MIVSQLNIPFSIGPGRSKCNNGTLHLVATPGFLNYSWSLNYNINTLPGQSVIVNPLVDTSYFLKAELSAGRFAFDTVKIKVNLSSAIALGAYAGVCKGPPLILNAGNGFVNYTRSNGSTQGILQVVNAGIYSVAARTAQGCSSHDTINLPLFELPVVKLNKDTGICEGSGRLLEAWRFASYLWQDGSSTSAVNVKEPGIY